MNYKNMTIAALLLASSAAQALSPENQARLDKAKKYALVGVYAGGALATGATCLFYLSALTEPLYKKQTSSNTKPTFTERFAFSTASASCFAVAAYLALQAQKTLNNN